MRNQNELWVKLPRIREVLDYGRKLPDESYALLSSDHLYFVWNLTKPVTVKQARRAQGRLIQHFGGLATIDPPPPSPGSPEWEKYELRLNPEMPSYTLKDFHIPVDPHPKTESESLSSNDPDQIMGSKSPEQISTEKIDALPPEQMSSDPEEEEAAEDTSGSDGWIKLYRKSIRSQVFQNEGLWKVWTWCLMKANHDDNWVPVRTGRGITQVLVKRGQFIFGRKSAARELKMVKRTVHKRMLKLKSMRNCDIQSDSHYSIVTILNYDLYQSKDFNEVTPMVTGKGQASDTNKNDKNIHYVGDSEEFQLASLLLSEIQKNKEDRNLSPLKEPDLQKWAKEIDLMMRRDGRKPERIREVILWCQGDTFWWSNVLSPQKLRKQFDRLEAGIVSKGSARKKIDYPDLTGCGKSNAKEDPLSSD